MFTAGKWEYNPPFQLLTPRRLRVLESAEKVIYIIQRIDPNYIVSSMDLDIHHMNVRSWETLVLSIIKSGLLRNACMKLHLRKFLLESKKTMLLFSMQLMRSSYRITRKWVHNMNHTRTIVLKFMREISIILILWVWMKIKNDLSMSLKANSKIHLILKSIMIWLVYMETK